MAFDKSYSQVQPGVLELEHDKWGRPDIIMVFRTIHTTDGESTTEETRIRLTEYIAQRIP